MSWTETERFPKPPATAADLEAERQLRLAAEAITSTVTETADEFILTTTWPGQE
jgi:hypothetical protein